MSAPEPIHRMALGLAALGRPAYLTSDRDGDLGEDRSPQDLRVRTHAVLDAAYGAGVRHVDVARSYGAAEEFLASWLGSHPEVDDLLVSSKWGYRYVAQWRVDAPVQEVKDHGLATFDEQWRETTDRLGSHVALYQVHSLTPRSPVLGDPALLDRLAGLRDRGVAVGVSVSGPDHSASIRAVLAVEVGGRPLFTSVQATWNLLETSAADALAEAAAQGCRVIVKEALANGRLADRTAPRPLVERAAALGVGTDAVALAAALALPFAPTVLSGAVSVPQLTANLAACRLEATEASELAVTPEPPDAYWSRRSERPWR